MTSDQRSFPPSPGRAGGRWGRGPGSRRLLAASVLPLLLLGLAAPAARAQVERGGTLPGPLPLFPPDNWWNLDVSAAPVDPKSADFIGFIGPDTPLHPDFGGDVDPDDPSNPGVFGMIYAVVPGTQPLAPVTFVEFGSESDAGAPGRPPGYPIPVEARTQPRWIEGGEPGDADPGGDRHMLLVDRDNRLLFELYHTHWNTALSRWEAGSGAVFPLDSNARRPEGWTSADAAGLAILPGLVRHDEVFGPDPIRHAFRMTVRRTNGHVFPASHTACDPCPADALPMGARLRLKPGTVISGHPPEIQKIFQAMKTYGLIVADNGSDMFITGAYDARWNNDVLNPAFASLTAGDFEVVELGWKPPVPITAGPFDFHTVTPCRAVDTRDPAGPFGGPAIASGSQRIFTLVGRCDIPATAKALSVNVTVVGAGAAGHFTFFPGDATPPGTSTINFGAGQTRANSAVLPLAASGTGTLGAAFVAPAGSVHLIVDVNGYFE